MLSSEILFPAACALAACLLAHLIERRERRKGGAA